MYRVLRDLELNPLCIVAGGAGRALVDQLSMPRRYVENLVLDGLARIALSERDAGEMRALFLLLLLANLAFFAWWRYGAPADAADPAPLARQIEPEKLKVIAPASLPPPAAAMPREAGARIRRVRAACMEWGSFTLADAPRAEQALEPLALGARLAQRRTEEIAGWWVFIPPQGSRQARAARRRRS